MTNPVNNTKNIQRKEVSTVSETKKPEINYSSKYEWLPVKGVKDNGKSFQFKIGNEVYLIRRALSTDFTEYDISTKYVLCIKTLKDTK